MEGIVTLAATLSANCATHLRVPEGVHKDEVAALLLQSLELANQLYALNEALRPCPGAYWRPSTSGQECGSTDKTRSFTQGYLGPAVQSVRRLSVCNTCGTKYQREVKKNGLLCVSFYELVLLGISRHLTDFNGMRWSCCVTYARATRCR